MAKFTTKNIEFKDDQKAIFGTADDSAIYWDGILNDLIITTTISGVTPIQGYHLATKQYVDDDISTINVYDVGTVVSGSPFESLNFIDCVISGSPTISGAVDIIPLFGSDFQEASDDTESSTTSTSYQQKLRLTTGSIATGKYRIGWYYEWQYDSIVNGILARIQINDSITIMEQRQDPQDPGSDQWHPASGFKYTTLSGAENIDLDYAASGNTVFIRRARIETWRVS